MCVCARACRHMPGIIIGNLEVLFSNSHPGRYIIVFFCFVKGDNLAAGDEVIYLRLYVLPFEKENYFPYSVFQNGCIFPALASSTD